MKKHTLDFNGGVFSEDKKDDYEFIPLTLTVRFLGDSWRRPSFQTGPRAGMAGAGQEGLQSD